MQLRQLVYMSEARDDLTKSDVEDILSICRQKNSERNISGLLIKAGSVFIQALEGDPDDLDRLYKSICADNRHHDAEIISDNLVDNRMFSGWTMAYIDSNAEELARGAGIDGTLNHAELMALLSQDDSWVSQILWSFAQRLNERTRLRT